MAAIVAACYHPATISSEVPDGTSDGRWRDPDSNRDTTIFSRAIRHPSNVYVFNGWTDHEKAAMTARDVAIALAGMRSRRREADTRGLDDEQSRGQPVLSQRRA